MAQVVVAAAAARRSLVSLGYSISLSEVWSLNVHHHHYYYHYLVSLKNPISLSEVWSLNALLLLLLLFGRRRLNHV